MSIEQTNDNREIELAGIPGVIVNETAYNKGKVDETVNEPSDIQQRKQAWREIAIEEQYPVLAVGINDSGIHIDGMYTSITMKLRDEENDISWGDTRLIPIRNGYYGGLGNFLRNMSNPNRVKFVKDVLQMQLGEHYAIGDYIMIGRKNVLRSICITTDGYFEENSYDHSDDSYALKGRMPVE